MVKQHTGLWVCNLAGQDNYGWGKQHTDYEALNVAFPKLRAMGERLRLPIAIPYKMGCVRGGGDWEEVLELIKEQVPQAQIFEFDFTVE